MSKARLWIYTGVIALVLTSCGGADGPETGDTTPDGSTEATAGSETSGRGDHLLLLEWQAPSQLNAYLSTGTKDIQAGSLVLEPLAEYNAEGELVPALATEIPTVANGGVSEDLTQITWTLQPDVLWSDGTPLTASDVVFTWEYCSDEQTGCVSPAFGNVAGVEAVDDLTVTVTFDGPTPFPYVPFVGATDPVLQEAQFAGCVGEAATACTEQNFRPIGTGPYLVTDMRAEDTVLYEKNPSYRGIAESKPYLETVELKGGGDAEAAARSVLEIGEADYAWNLQVAPEILSQMEAGGFGSVDIGFNTTVEYLTLN